MKKLIFSKSKFCKSIVVLFLSLIGYNAANAVTYYSMNSGNFLTGSKIWSTDTVNQSVEPSFTIMTSGKSDFVVRNGHKITIDDSKIYVLSIKINEKGALLATTNSFTIQSIAVTSNTSLLIDGILDLGNFNHATLNNAKINNSKGKGEIRIGGSAWTGFNSTISGAFFSTPTNKISFYGGNNNLPAMTYPTLNLENGDYTFTAGGTITINGNLNLTSVNNLKIPSPIVFPATGIIPHIISATGINNISLQSTSTINGNTEIGAGANVQTSGVITVNAGVTLTNLNNNFTIDVGGNIAGAGSFINKNGIYWLANTGPLMAVANMDFTTFKPNSIIFRGGTASIWNENFDAIVIDKNTSISTTVNANSLSFMNSNRILTLNSAANLTVNGDVINGTGIENMIDFSSSLTASATLTINGNVNLNNKARIRFNSSVISITQNLILKGATNTIDTLKCVTNANSIVTFLGASSQSYKTSSSTFRDLIINNSATVLLNSPIKVDNKLTLTQGRLQIVNNNLTLASPDVNNTRISGWIETNGTGVVQSQVVGTYTYHIGNNQYYQPVKINNSTGLNSARFGTGTTLPSGGVGSWFIKPAAATTVTFTSPQPLAGLSSSSKIASVNAGKWTTINTSGYPTFISQVTIPATSAEYAVFDLSPTTVSAVTNISPNSFTINWSATAASLVLQISKDPSFATIDYNQNSILGTTKSITITKANFATFDPTKIYYVRLITSSDGITKDGQISNVKAFSAILPPGSGNALTLNGTTQYVNVGTDTSFNYNQINNFTIEAWVKLDSSATGKNVIFSKRNQNFPWDGYGVLLENTGTNVNFLVDFGNTTSGGIITGFTFNTWYHVAVVFQGSSFTRYINGVLHGSGSGLAFPKTIGVIPRIGTYNNNINYFKGSIDEVRIWNTNRSLANLQTTMCQKLQGNESNLAGYFRFDEGFGGTSENKASVATTDASIVGTSTWGTSAAAIGDVSIADYTAGNTNLGLNSEGNFIVSGYNLSFSQGMQVYKIKQAPNFNTFGTGIDSLQKNGYWGVFPVGISNYAINYLYGGNTALEGKSYEAGVVLASRTDNSSTTWTKVSTTKADVVNNSITTPTLSARSEFIAALGPLPSNIIYVDLNAAGSNDGSTWTNAYKSLPTAISAASSGKLIYVAQGTYYAGNTSAQSLSIPSGVTIYGGFKSGDKFSDRDSTLITKKVIFSGNFQQDADSTNNTITFLKQTSATNVSINGIIFEHMFNAGVNGGVLSNTTSNTSFVNCSFRKNTSPSTTASGSVLFNASGIVNFTNCIIENNYGQLQTGAILRYQTGSEGNIKNCIFRNNVIDGNSSGIGALGKITISSSTFKDNLLKGTNGSAVISANAYSGGSLTIKGSDFTNNIGGNGGACINAYYTVIIQNCKFIGNSAKMGGAIWMQNINKCYYDISNCLFYNNIATAGAGGAIYFAYGEGDNIFSNCTFVGNKASGSNGNVFYLQGDNNAGNGTLNVLLKNSIIWNNGTGNPFSTVYDCIVSSNNSIIQNGQYGGINSDPLFKDVAIGDLNLTSCSPAINAGNNSFLSSDILDVNNNGNTNEPLPIDLASKTRKFGTNVDLGAYEFQTIPPSAPTATISGTSTICNGAKTNLTVILTGSEPWSFTYFDGTKNTTISNITDPNTGARLQGARVAFSPYVYTLTVNPTINTTYTLTSVSDASCSGSTAGNAVIIVTPLPVITPIVDQAVCVGNPFARVNFVSTIAGSSFNYTNSQSSIGLANTGSGDFIAAFNGKNTGSTQVDAQIIVTPQNNGCNGKPDTFQLSVKPLPSVFAGSNQTVCAENKTSAITFTGSPVSTTFTWTNDQISIGLAASGTGNIASFIAKNTGTSTVLANINVTPQLNGCSGTATSLNITVNPLPTVNAILGQTVCSASNFSAINFSGSIAGTTYNWTNSLPTIGLAAGGNGNINAFTAINTDSVQVNAKIVVTPSLNGCVGKKDSLVISVKPKPALTALSNQTVCNGNNTSIINFKSVPNGGSFAWTNNLTSIGLAASGTVNITSFQALNTANTSVNATINVTPTINGCVGSAVPLTITVNPTPTLNAIANQTYCAGNIVPASSFVSNVTGTTFSWTNDNTSIGMIGTGGGNYVSFIATNPSSSAIVGNFKVTPTANTCVGTAQNFSITVNPQPTATIGFNVSSVCKTGSNPVLKLASGASAGTFTIPSGLAINQANGIVDLTNTQPGTYVVTNTFAAANGCNTVSDTANLTVFASPKAGFSYPSGSVCKTGLNPVVVLNAGASADTFTSTPSGLNLNASTGTITLGTSFIGTYKVYNSIAANGGCAATKDSTTISITDAPNATFSYAGSPFCSSAANPSATFTEVGASGGVFSAGTGLVFLNNNTGLVDLKNSTAGTYTVTNTIAASGLCAAAVATSSITIQKALVPNFSYTGKPYCSNAVNPSPTFSAGAVAGNFTFSPAGLNLNSSTGLVNLTSSTAGKFNVTNTIAAVGACPKVEYSDSIFITKLPDASFSFSNANVCKNAINPTTTLNAGAKAGVFSSTPSGLFINSSTGAIDIFSSNKGTYTVSNTIAAAGGCASVTSSQAFTISPTKNSSFAISACGSYLFNGSSRTVSGVYLDTLSSKQNCDSVITLNLTIKQPSSNNITLTACSSYFFNGFNRTLSGVYKDTLVNSLGCDSVITLNLTINQTNTASISKTTCGSYFFNGFNRTISGVYKDTLVNSFGCDSVITLNLTINQPNSASISKTACSSFFFNGLNRTVSGIFKDTLVNKLGCDSVITLNLTINQPNSASISKTSCSLYFFNGLNRTLSGIYKDTLLNAVGCDSVISLNLTINQPNSGSISKTACSSFFFNGLNRTVSGIYKDTLLNSFGCDSVITLNLTINQPNSASISKTSCSSFFFNGLNRTISGTYKDTLLNSFGCDSVITLNLTINQPSTSSISKTTCSSYFFNGLNRTISGIYKDTLVNAESCDSIITLNLTISQPDSASISKTDCDSYFFNGLNRTISGIYKDTLVNSLGCDSIIILNLTIGNPENITVNKSVCTSYNWNETNLTSSGTFKDTLTSKFGCDSIVSLNLSLGLATATISKSSCNAYNFNGKTLNSTGFYYDTLKAVSGCDSVITLNLTINQPTTSTISKITCSDFFFNGTNRSISGIYKDTLVNSLGCDSVITLNLTINQPTTAFISKTACSSYFFNGTNRTLSGIYLDTLVNTWGCDSVITLNLTINQPTTASISKTACGSYFFNGSNRTISGIYKDTLVNSLGCDSVLTLNLTINPCAVNASYLVSNSNPALGDTVIFTSNSTGSTIDSYLWNFGADANPQTSTSAGPIKVVFGNTGKKVVSLTVTSGTNSSTYTDSLVEVKTSIPLSSSFTVSNLNPLNGVDTVVFTSTSTGNIDAYEWSFGADSKPATATGQGPIKVVFNNTGKKIVSLTVKNGPLSSTHIDTLINVKDSIKVVLTTTAITQNEDTIKAEITNPQIGVNYSWFANPINAVTFSSNALNPILTFADSISGKIKVNAVATYPNGFKDTSEVVIKRSGEYKVKVDKVSVFYNDSVPVTVNFRGSAPYALNYTIGTDSITLTNIQTPVYTFNVGYGQLNVLKIIDKDSVPITYAGGAIPRIILDTITAVLRKSENTTCTQAISPLYLKITGGKAPYEVKIDGFDYDVNAEDTLMLKAGRFIGTITDAAGYVTKNQVFVVDSSKVSFLNVYPVLESDSVIKAGEKVSLKVAVNQSKLKDFITKNYTWTYSTLNNDTLVKKFDDGQGISNISTITMASNYSGYVYVNVKVNYGTCSSSVSQPLRITVLPNARVKSTPNKSDPFVFTLVGKQPFRLQYEADGIKVDTMITDTSFALDNEAVFKVGLVRITDANGITQELTDVTLDRGTYDVVEGFSPEDGDNINEYFYIFNYIDSQDKFIFGAKMLYVYDLNGFEVYNCKEYKNDWNGYSGSEKNLIKPLADGIYHYKLLNPADKSEFKKGYVMIKRK